METEELLRPPPATASKVAMQNHSPHSKMVQRGDNLDGTKRSFMGLYTKGYKWKAPIFRVRFDPPHALGGGKAKNSVNQIIRMNMTRMFL
jgi:hypothetical protein